MYDYPAKHNAMNPNINKSICIIGSGAAGLITAHTLIQDGFTKVHILTQDPSPGGVWNYNKVYSGVFINKCASSLAVRSQPEADVVVVYMAITDSPLCKCLAILTGSRKTPV